MDYKRYRRYFIILDCEDNGFNNKQGKNPKGYTKIEIKNGKGVLNYYIQNLKYFDQAEYIYRGYLIGTKEGNEIYTSNGALMIDESGKGELSWKFDANDIDGKGNSIQNFNVIAIVAEPRDLDRNQKNILAPLVGFIDKQKVEWKYILSHSSDEVEQQDQILVEKYEEKLEEIAEVIKEDPEEERVKVEEPPADAKGVKEMTEEETTKEDPEEERVQAEETLGLGGALDQEETTEEETMKDYDKKETEEIKSQYENEEAYRCEEPKEHSKMKSYNYENVYPYYQHSYRIVSDYIKNILKYYPRVEPFEKNIEGCKWWKIDCTYQTQYRNFLPFYGYTYQYSHMNYMTGYSNPICSYEHYIFGISSDKKDQPRYYMYGIPGRFILKEQPYGGMTGFVYWHPIQDKKRERGDYGYWILHIDPKTGNVIVPLKPTPPPQ